MKAGRPAKPNLQAEMYRTLIDFMQQKKIADVREAALKLYAARTQRSDGVIPTDDAWRQAYRRYKNRDAKLHDAGIL